MTDATPRSTHYVRRLGVFDTTMVVIGGIIGAGIFLNPAIVAQRVHTAAFILTTWAVGGAIALVGALSFAELGVIGTPAVGDDAVPMRGVMRGGGKTENMRSR